MTRVLVTGGGGFIGAHLVSYLKGLGYWVRAADLRRPEFGETLADEFAQVDLRNADECRRVTEDIDQVYALAADMGGIGYISTNDAKIFHNNTLIDLNTIEAAFRNGVRRYLFTSSACVYPRSRQTSELPVELREKDAYPADPPTAYGWEKLTSEQVLAAYSNDYGIETRIVRLHNVYGPEGTYKGGREKAPAALCRKVAEALPASAIEVWGDGRQMRSFCYVSDCVEGLHRVMLADVPGPLNLGSDRVVSINELVQMILDIAGKPDLTTRHVDGPQGVRGRNSDNTLLGQTLSWVPGTTLEVGLQTTYAWIAAEIERTGASLR